MLRFVTGLSGVGKSTVCRALRQRGLDAVDTDDGLACWRHRTSRLVIRDRPAGGATAEFLADHDLVVPRTRVEALRARPGTWWLCGGVGNDAELWDLFDEVVCLVVDEATLRHRLAARTGNSFGKAPDELAAVIGWHGSHADFYERRGARLVDASRPVAQVVVDVVGTAGSTPE
jgi:hypothetical protein